MHINLIVPLLLTAIFSGCSNHNFVAVNAKIQTEYATTQGDVVDDPAIWVDNKDDSKSLIIGTNKKGGGLEVYTLDGSRIQSLKDGDFNNVDLRYGFDYNGTKMDIVVASNRTDDTLAIYGINAKNHKLFAISLNALHTLDKSYGQCMYKDGENFYVITNNKLGEIIMQHIEANGTVISAKIVGKAKVASQPEGCVVDDETNILYVGEEDFGIWKFDLGNGLKNNGAVFDSIKENKNLQDDIEGLTLYKQYLIASSQGNNSYAVYEKKNGKYIGSFVISDGIIDGTNDTDGIDATSVKVGNFNGGIFVAQDGSTEKTQNFKVVDFDDIIKSLKNIAK